MLVHGFLFPSTHKLQQHCFGQLGQPRQHLLRMAEAAEAAGAVLRCVAKKLPCAYQLQSPLNHRVWYTGGV